jgi:hypothetical protein
VDGETIKVEDQIELCTEEILARGAVVGEVFPDNSLSVAGGVARVDRSMAPILATIDKLRVDLAAQDAPDTAQAAAADAVAAWREAQDVGDVVLMRRLIRSAFPDLAEAMPSGRGDHSPSRLLWNGAPA